MSHLDISDNGRVRTLTLQREAALNAFDDELYRDLARALNETRHRPDIAVTLLTGKGRAFSAGQDMAQMADIGRDVQHPSARQSDVGDGPGFPILMAALEAFDKPLIAAVNGLGVGLGFTILAHCDLVVMATDARLRAPFCPLGVAPEAASSYLFPARMGWQRAAWTLLSGDWITAVQALEMGIAWKIVAPDKVVATAQETARAIARWPIPSLVATKRAMLDGQRVAVQRARQVEDAAFTELIGSPANIEAVTAFLEKRDPDFTDIEGA